MKILKFQEYINESYLESNFAPLYHYTSSLDYIISDDIAWCKKEKWNSTKKIVFYDEPDEMKTLYLMSQCSKGSNPSTSV